MASPRKFIQALKKLSPKFPSFSLPIHQTPKKARNLSLLNVDTPNVNKIIDVGIKTPKSVIGSGGFGTVYKASYKGSEVAAKVLQRKSTSDDAIDAEMQAASFRHSSIVRILGMAKGRTLALITMELCGPSLQDVVEERELEPQERTRFLNDVARALKYCHFHNVVHADVKPKNILVVEGGRAKLGDFGNSINTMDQKTEKATTFKGTAGYVAPEVVKGRNPASQSDIYSLGVVAWQMLSRKMPFAGLHPHTIIYLTGKGNKPEDDADLEDGFEGKYKTLYRQMWQDDPEQRPKSTEITCFIRNELFA